MDHLLASYLYATDQAERQQHLEELLLFYASPVVRQILRRRLGFYVNQQGRNPHNLDAEDLYQEIMTKIVQTLHDLVSPSTKIVIENLNQYVARIASNACNDFLRTKSPARARLKNNLRFVLNHHQDFAVWKMQDETLCGFAVWRDSSKSQSSERELVNIEDGVTSFRLTRFPKEDIKDVPLTKILAELFGWIGSPVELDVLVNIVARFLDVKDQPLESVDDETNSYLEARLADSQLGGISRLEAQALLRSLWQALRELVPEQRDVFCFGFEDQSGRDLFTVLLEAEIANLGEIARELGRSPETIGELWAKMPMDVKAIAIEMKTTRAQISKWRFRALGRLKKGLLPFSGEK